MRRSSCSSKSYLQEVGATVSELDVLTYAIEGTEVRVLPARFGA